ncbi:uncharacterized protein C13G5.2-like [Eupeodes corollae]|uniref:uncharacterized protein C13G5.2-like n=1 Tax=Eupeodes corollae TaxID=290404 RepID=UPI002491A48E|nr:uncharacterized protein C13G5.2-like [Eupeodes corollae]XP_055914362.1 uncharacterized protein C13G5.2-like [Eupeodes corollae]XP_055914363.1 uncharacterized protein C13G5.2-like [Eupeodes corollae]
MANDRKANEGFDSILKSTLIFKLMEGYKYTLQVSHLKTTAVNVMRRIDKGNNTNNWLLRFDNPHKGAPFPHINIRHKYTGIQDPHLKLPPGSITVAQGGAYIAKALDWLCYATIIYDGIQLCQAIYRDHQNGNGTMENTAECAADKTGQYVGGFTGALVGQTVGSFLLPGVGPLVGAVGLGYLGVGYGRKVAAFYFQNYWSDQKLKSKL